MGFTIHMHIDTPAERERFRGETEQSFVRESDPTASGHLSFESWEQFLEILSPKGIELVNRARGPRLKPSEILELHREEIREIIDTNSGKNPRIFGSVARGEDTADSDIDILIDPTASTSLLSIAVMTRKIEKILDIKVDICTPNSLPTRSRDEIIRTAIPL